MQPICRDKIKIELSHYVKYNNGNIEHRPARGKDEDRSLARPDRETFNSFHCQNFKCNRLDNHPTTIEFRIVKLKKEVVLFTNGQSEVAFQSSHISKL